jgi:hypothetical protein
MKGAQARRIPMGPEIEFDQQIVINNRRELINDYDYSEWTSKVVFVRACTFI